MSDAEIIGVAVLLNLIFLDFLALRSLIFEQRGDA